MMHEILKPPRVTGAFFPAEILIVRKIGLSHWWSRNVGASSLLSVPSLPFSTPDIVRERCSTSSTTNSAYIQNGSRRQKSRLEADPLTNSVQCMYIYIQTFVRRKGNINKVGRKMSQFPTNNFSNKIVAWCHRTGFEMCRQLAAVAG